MEIIVIGKIFFWVLIICLDSNFLKIEKHFFDCLNFCCIEEFEIGLYLNK